MSGSVPDGAFEVTAYDATPPMPDGVSVPGSGIAGSPLAFAATPFDAWSAVEMSWDFGGGTATTVRVSDPPAERTASHRR